MDLQIWNMLDELINIFENSEEIQTMTKLKDDILKDELLKEKLDKLKMMNSHNDIYNAEYVSLKKEILNFDKVKRYKELENDLYFLVLEINKKLKELVNEKGCINENN